MGYSPEKTEREGVEDILTPPPTPVEFLIFYVMLSLEIPDKTKLHPLKFYHIFVRSLGNFKNKIQDSWRFHIIFSPLEIPLRL